MTLTLSQENRYLGGILILFLALTAWAYPHIPRADALTYLDFADQVAHLGIPNFNDVVSNLAFLAAGLYGLIAFTRRPDLKGHGLALLTVSIGSVLTAFGSAQFHWAPGNYTLMLDRLPMTIVFAGVISALIGDRIGRTQGLVALGILLPFGVFSILGQDAGFITFRPYYALQHGGLIFCLLLALMRPSGRMENANVLAALGLYTVAKILEIADGPIFRFTENLVSGHSLKHLFAALAVYKLIVTIQEK